MLSVGFLVHVQNSFAAVFVLCADGKQDLSLSGHELVA